MKFTGGQLWWQYVSDSWRLFPTLPCGVFVFLAPSRRLLLLRHHQHNISNTTSSTQHHQHYTIYTINHQKQHHRRSAEVRRRLSIADAGCVCVAGAALGDTWSTSVSFCFDWVLWTPAAFAQQAQHLEHLSLILRGRRSTWSTSLSFCVSSAACGAPPEWSAEVRRRLSIVDAGCICVAGAALLEHLSLILRGRCSTRSTSREVRESTATIEYCGRRLHLRGRRSTFGAPQSHFAWQVQHFGHLSFSLRGRCSTRSTSREVRGSGQRCLLEINLDTERRIMSLFCLTYPKG